MIDLPLPGGTPEPLMSYLKALGVFRLVAEQTDTEARLSWRGGIAYLHSKLDRPGLEKFFLDEYRPTPITNPWNGGSGFYRTWDETGGRFRNREAVDRVRFILQSNDTRLAKYRGVLEEIAKTLARCAKPIDVGTMSKKERNATLLLDETHGILDVDQPDLFPHLRATLPDEAVEWLDVVLLLQLEETRAAPLFISGGNDGNFDFSVTFMGCLQTLLSDRERMQGWLLSSVFADGLEGTDKGTTGHFHPGGLGGPNAGQGFSGQGSFNPWDFVFMVEGAVLLAGAVSRRLGVQTGDKVAFPFCVMPVAAGFGSAASIDELSDACRTELWLPLWIGNSTLSELRYLFSEGRAQVGRRQARNAVEFALATCLLGVNRGIVSFVRFGFLRRFGKMFLAAPLSRIQVTLRPQARLLNDPPLTTWVDALRRACRDKDKTPARYQTTLRHIDRAIFDFANRSELGNDAKYLADVLVALGQAERTLANGLGFCKEKRLRPMQGLDPQWIEQADDGSREFRLAASLAGIQGRSKVGPLRVFLEEVEVTKFVNWSPGSSSAVWWRRSLPANLAAVFRRRQLVAFSDGQAGVPLYSPRPAGLADVVAFLNAETDDDKLADLIWGLSALDWSAVHFRIIHEPDDEVAVPVEFGIPRLLVEPGVAQAKNDRWKYQRAKEGDETNARPDPDVFHVLTSGRDNAVEQCVDRAAGRLKSAGLLITGYRNRYRSGKPLHVQSPFSCERLLAALLFPLSDRDLELIANHVLYPPETEA